MPEPGRALAGAARVAERVVFSIPHPATDTAHRAWRCDADGNRLALEIDRYFDGGQEVLRWEVERLSYPFATPRWRLTLGEWSELTASAGLAITRLVEPRPTAEQVAATPDLDDCHRLPYFLLFDCVAFPE